MREWRRVRREVLAAAADALIVAGGAMLVHGVALVSAPLAWCVAGVLTAGVGALIARRVPAG